jgi:ABC-type glycerol-3-phosphate transport system substrate-binding protein
MSSLRILALLALGMLAACSGDLAAAAELSHAWHDAASDGGLNAGPAAGESNSIGMAP